MSEWISVDDELPEEHSDVLVYYETSPIKFRGGVLLGPCHYMTQSSYYNDMFEMENRPHTVTHWMPLPEPPNP